MQELVIEKGVFNRKTLIGKTILLTGGGGGIGFETARALVWMGADVIIAEIDEALGKNAQDRINAEMECERACFFPVDLCRDEDIKTLYAFINDRYGRLDVLFNNATIAPIGEAHTVGVEAWDKSYAVNLRAPVLLLQYFLPDMLRKNSGIVVFVPSSGAAPYMGAYEVFKTAQVELCNTLAAELEGTDIITYSVGPGLVQTDTAKKSIQIIARKMGISEEEFYIMNKDHMLEAEEAGAGFAASVALAKMYAGQEISSIQALTDAKIVLKQSKDFEKPVAITESAPIHSEVLENIVTTFNEQYNGWMTRNIFERQWIFRDFKKETGYAAELVQAQLSSILNSDTKSIWPTQEKKKLFSLLQKYYLHQIKLLQGYEKDVRKREENTKIMEGWIADLKQIIDMLD